jgi:outer membrane protein
MLILLSLTGMTQPPQEKVITLRECLDLAITNSPRLKISQLDQSKLQYQLQETKGKGLPSVNFTGAFDDYVNLPTQLIPGEFFGMPGQLVPVQFGTTYNLSGSLDASQLLYNQSFLVALKMARQALDKSRLETERTRIDVVFEVARSYYLTQITRLQIKNLRSNVEKLEKAENIARSQYENGFIKRVDMDRITVNKLNLQTEIDRLEVLYQQELSMQRYYMGLDPGMPIAFTDSVSTAVIMPETPGDLENHIDIKLIEKQRELISTNLSLSRSEYFPSLTLIGSTNYINQTNTYYVTGKSTDWFNTSLVGLRLNVPVFNGFQKRAKVSQSKVELKQISITEEDTKKLLRIQSQDAMRNLLSNITSEQRQRENQKLAERVYSISQEQYQQGLIPLTDLLNSETALSDAMTGHVTSLVQMKLAELEYLKANGKLMSILN